MIIREASGQDQAAIRTLYAAAFPAQEAETVAALAVELLATDTPAFSLVSEADGQVFAHIAFSPVCVDDDSGIAGFILAPLAVLPEFQKNGTGSKLVEAGLDRLVDEGADFVLVYGDPAYYGRFGFDADIAAGFLPPYPLEYPFGWQCRLLGDRAGGRPPVGISCVAALSRPELW